MGKCYVWSLTKEEIQDRVNKCDCICDMLVEFGFKRTSGSMAKVMKKIIEYYEIDISHFGSRRRKQNVGHAKYSLEEILVKNSSYANTVRLKRRLIKEGLLEYRCAICGNEGIWNNKKLVLQLDHIDGDHSNNSIENLRFLCPNCHSQTDTYSGKNAKCYKG